MKTPEVISADRTYYVRKDGNDANNGKFNTAAGAWLTIQHGMNWLATNVRIAYGVVVTIQIGDGTYTENIALAGSPLGGQITLQGNTSNMNAVVIAGGAERALIAEYGAVVKIRYLKFTGTGDFVIARFNATLFMEACNFSATSGTHITSDRSGVVIIQGAYTISGGCKWHVWATQGSSIRYTGPFTVTISGTPAWVNHFAFGDSCGIIQFFANITFSGGATGARYLCSLCGCIYVAGAGATYLPGNANGTAANGGVYA